VEHLPRLLPIDGPARVRLRAYRGESAVGSPAGDRPPSVGVAGGRRAPAARRAPCAEGKSPGSPWPSGALLWLRGLDIHNATRHPRLPGSTWLRREMPSWVRFRYLWPWSKAAGFSELADAWGWGRVERSLL